MSRWIAALCVLLLPLSLAAAMRSPKRLDLNSKTGAAKYRMCDAQTAVGVCDTSRGGTGDDWVLNAVGYRSITIYHAESTALSYSCDIYGNSEGTGSPGQLLNTPAFTQADPDALTLNDINLAYVWIQCTAISVDGNVTVDAVLGY